MATDNSFVRTVKNAWEKVTNTTTTPKNSGYVSMADLNAETNGSGVKPDASKASKLSSGSQTQVNSTAKAEKEQAILEYNTLEGDLELRLHTNSLRVKRGKTISVNGIGDYLSGLYFVSKVKYTLNTSSPFGITATLIKTGFGDGVKPDLSAVVEGVRSEVIDKSDASQAVPNSTTAAIYTGGGY